MARKVIYPGVLGKPRKFDLWVKAYRPERKETDLLSMITEAGFKEDAKLDREMLSELKKYYDISPDDPHAWEKLSYRLAMDHVPGFTMEKAPRGKPRYWNRDRYEKLVKFVERYKEAHPGSENIDAFSGRARQIMLELNGNGTSQIP